MKTNKLPPIHPGEILGEEFMKPRGLLQNALARALDVRPRRINEIVLEKRGITADTALQKCGRVCRPTTIYGWHVMKRKNRLSVTLNRSPRLNRR
jgi:addiction module HigA family antidote